MFGKFMWNLINIFYYSNDIVILKIISVNGINTACIKNWFIPASCMALMVLVYTFYYYLLLN